MLQPARHQPVFRAAVRHTAVSDQLNVSSLGGLWLQLLAGSAGRLCLQLLAQRAERGSAARAKAERVRSERASMEGLALAALHTASARGAIGSEL